MVDRGNIQAIVARRSRRRFLAILLLKIDDAAKAKAFLAAWISRTPGGLADPDTLTDPVLHFAFSWNGLRKLLAGDVALEAAAADSAHSNGKFESCFRKPEEAPDHPGKARELGLLGDSAPQNWWKGWRSAGAGFATSDIDVAVHISCLDEAERTPALQALRRSALGRGLQELRIESETFPDGALAGYLPDGGRLHFGYRDGITDPDIHWDETSALPAGKVDFRQFVLGYANEEYESDPQKGPWRDFARDGSFACMTWIRQDVPKFNRFSGDNRAKVATFRPHDAEDWLAAKLVGRWRNGAPLAKYPHAQPPGWKPEDDDDTKITYDDDPVGLRCPLTAHIRVVNPRDQKLRTIAQPRHPGPPRLLRRGFTYGEPLAIGDVDDKDRGIVGFFFCAGIEAQFYKILRWIQRTDFSDIFYDTGISEAQDALVGSRLGEDPKTEISIPLENMPPLTLSLGEFIQYRGVVVLFAPSLKSLRMLAGE
jgi:deferrochelatase/peroxidase EfeB